MDPVASLTSTVPSLIGQGALATPHGEGEKLKDACNSFVGVLYSYVFSQMRQGGDSEEEGSLFGGDNSQMMMGFLDQSIGQKLAETDGNGLSKQLLWQLKAQQSQPPGGKTT